MRFWLLAESELVYSLALSVLYLLATLAYYNGATGNDRWSIFDKLGSLAYFSPWPGLLSDLSRLGY
jgi:hypothetical protein